jgi:hypothetical protein
MRIDIPRRRRLEAGLPEWPGGRRRVTGARWSGGFGCAADETGVRLFEDGVDPLRVEAGCGQSLPALVRLVVGGMLVRINDCCSR